MSKKDWQQLFGAQAMALVAYFLIGSDQPRVWLYIFCILFFILITRKNYPQNYVRIAIWTSLVYLLLINFVGVLVINSHPQPIIWRRQTLDYQVEVTKQRNNSVINFVESLKIKEQVKNKDIILNYSKQNEAKSRFIGQMFQVWAARVKYNEIPQNYLDKCNSSPTISLSTCEVKVCDDTQYYVTKCEKSL